jgi:uncharacterized damage-inducible protein DinB
MSDPRYPIGQFAYNRAAGSAERAVAVAAIAELPERLAAAARGLSDEQLDTPYREGGWTLRQVVHHLADSHVNAWVRMKLTLTAPHPTIVPYDEAAWARLPDAALPVEVSLRLLAALHARWDTLWRSLSDSDWSRTFRHPEYDRDLSLDWMVQMYAWHGRHHVAHITSTRERHGW